MSDDIFRLIIAVGVSVIALAFLVQMFAGLAAARAARAIKDQVAALAGRFEPLIEKAGLALDKAGPTMDKLALLIDKAGPGAEQIGPVLARIGPLMDKAGPPIEKITAVAQRLVPVAERLEEFIALSRDVVEETRPKVAEISAEAAEIARAGRMQVNRLGDLLADAGSRARSRLEQIDQMVENTVGKVEHVGENMRRTVTRPVREVNGIAAGVAAAVSALVKGRRGLDAATQDEELFI